MSLVLGNEYNIEYRKEGNIVVSMFQKVCNECNHSIFIFNRLSLETVFVNKKAKEKYSENNAILSMVNIFPSQHKNSLNLTSILEEIKKEKEITLYDVPTYGKQGMDENNVIQIGIADLDADLIYLQIYPPIYGNSTTDDVEDIGGYFEILQSLSKDFLYRFDIKEKTLYRNQATAQLYGLPAIVKNYPDPDQLQDVFHPDDIEDYVKFFKKVLQGEECSHTARMVAPSGHFEYHAITFKQLNNPDGSLREMIGNAVNVHDLVETEEKLANINRYFDILQTLSKDLIYRLDIEKKTLYRNEQTSKYYGIPSVVKNYPNLESVSCIIHPDDVDGYIHFILKVLEGEEGVHTSRMLAPSGKYEHHRFTFKQMKNFDGTIKEMIGTAENIQTIKELENKASFDLLTGCYNKISFQEKVEEVLGSNLEEPHALFFLDLDEFKFVNDNLGHAFGDYLIQELGKRLRENVRKEDFVGRVGGDEFVIFIKNVTCREGLLGKAKMILSAIGEDICDGNECHVMRGSIGISQFPIHGKTYEELYHRADLALYQSKQGGKNTATFYDASLDR